MKNRKFDLIIQNLAAKKEWVITGLVDASFNSLYYLFNDFEMPEDAESGEYSYALIYNERDDVRYTLKNDILDTIVDTDEGSITLRLLRPETGLFRYGKIEQKNKYRNKNRDFIYRTK